MNPRHGEVWLVDMGMAAKTRPAVVLIAVSFRALANIIHRQEKVLAGKS